MTIKIERDSPLRVLETATSYQQLRHAPSIEATTTALPNDDEFLLMDLPLCAAPVGKLREPVAEDDDTISTGSISSSDSETSTPLSSSRRVSFAENLVADVWTRPYTPREDVSLLFYSTEETSRFRQEYRLERKLLSELAVDPRSVSETDLSALVSDAPATSAPYRISRVVVLHDGKLATYQDANENDTSWDDANFWQGQMTWLV